MRVLFQGGTMKRSMHLLLILLVLPSLLNGLSRYDKNFIEQHLLPTTHPLTPILNYALSNATDLTSALEEAGFEFLKKKNQIVAYHPIHQNWLIKALPTDKTFKTDGLNLRRVYTAEEMRELLVKYKIEDIVIPTKYLYHIPNTKSSLSDRHYIVIAERLDLIDKEEALQKIKKLPQETIDHIYLLIKKVGIYDARVLNENITMTENGQVAFIDTEPRWHFYNTPKFFQKIVKKFLGKRGRNKFHAEVARSMPLVISSLTGRVY
jgi:hypothetical protein